MKTKIILIIVVVTFIVGAFFAGRYIGEQNAQAALWARKQPNIYAVLECDIDQAYGMVSCYGAIQK